MSDIRDSSASGEPYFLKLLKETVDLSKNLYDMTTYEGRASHFYRSVNPLNLFKDHVSARDVVRKGIVSSFYRGSRVNLSQLQGELRFCCGKTEKVQADGGAIPPGMSREDVWNAKYIYDSAYHPTTGELVFMPGRMSFQAPGNCIIASGMIIFYKTPLQNILGQLVNQSFNSTVNYSNAPVPKFVPQDFAVAAGSACAAAYSLNKMASRFANPLLARLVPFAAVCVANGINLPYMRRDEWRGSGMPLEDENGNVVGHSPKIGAEAIIKVVLCRILMATPTMVFPPIVIESLSKPGKLLTKNPALKNPLQVLLVGLSLVVATPAACAIWPQRDSTSVESLEPDVRDKLKSQGISTVYFNKGL